MSELENKYQIGVRRFNINWIGIGSLILKENLRYLTVAGQTIVGPIITSILFLVVINMAVGDDRANVLGVEFISFLAPGLIAMQIISQAFAHSSSSILMGKIMGNIFDLIGAPLSPAEVIYQLYCFCFKRNNNLFSVNYNFFFIFRNRG